MTEPKPCWDTTRLIRVVFLSGVAALLSACGGQTAPAPSSGVPATAAPAASPTTTAPPSGSPVATAEPVLDGAETLTTSREAMKSLESVRIIGWGTSADGTKTVLNLRASRAGRCVGSIGYNGDSAELIRIGPDVWIRAGARFWMSHAGVSRDFAAIVANKWAHGAGDGVTEACELGTLMATMYDDKLTTGQASAPPLIPEVVDGQQALSLRGKIDGHFSSLTVLAEAPHYVLRIHRNEADMAFSHFNEPVEATPPPADQVIETGGSGGPGLTRRR